MSAPVHKRRLSRRRRLVRLITGALDPRAWGHLLKVVNYYNYSHVAELRAAMVDPTANISPLATFANGRNLVIGARTTIGAGCYLWAGPNEARITVGDDTIFGPDVMVTATGYRYEDGAPINDQAMDEAPIEIGPDCWIGRGATILAGSSLGEGSIVGANAVVRGRFPPFSIVAGVPARVVSTRRIGTAD
ncbi:Acetyltransferase (isoleucine patch superfamily) [Palleronia marisminoris]|uniref:Putative acetyltransferase n=1 Tax=Palleronia marisminoris TaxID=315423 RepID=A0A1Y5SH84_9RHOB|nr:acyltransferase [Palleronia marisminoris]SFG82773.1 Acetyltransferase (isoleucine patch superfamily) [Palleronia marisminoris]SLN40730.1 Putative acetyltransferase [Palleronia marisminoris]